jgi:hypothetical protein
LVFSINSLLHLLEMIVKLHISIGRSQRQVIILIHFNLLINQHGILLVIVDAWVQSLLLKTKVLVTYGICMFLKRTAIISLRSQLKTHFKYLIVAKIVILIQAMFMKQLLLLKMAWLIYTLSHNLHMLKEMTSNTHLEYICNQALYSLLM